MHHSKQNKKKVFVIVFCFEKNVQKNIKSINWKKKCWFSLWQKNDVLKVSNKSSYFAFKRRTNWNELVFVWLEIAECDHS